jgi:serine/threonine protein kinase
MFKVLPLGTLIPNLNLVFCVSAARSVPNIQRFKELVKKARPDLSPKAEVLLKIWMKFPAEMIAAVEIDDQNLCYDLYDKVKQIPSTYTRSAIEKASCIVLNGPISLDFPDILLGVDLSANKRIAVKLIKFPILMRSTSHDANMQAMAAEAEACKALTSLDIEGLVKCEVVEVTVENIEQLAKGHIWQAIKMHDYGSSLEKLPQLPENMLQNGFHRILNALKGMHTNHYIHMDVKSPNVFVNGDLIWDLGDFGSVRKCGEKVWSWSETLTPFKMSTNCTVIKEMDIVQLCVMVAVELDKANKDKLCGEAHHVQPSIILEKLCTIKNVTFKEEVVKLFKENLSIVLAHVYSYN